MACLSVILQFFPKSGAKGWGWVGSGRLHWEGSTGRGRGDKEYAQTLWMFVCNSKHMHVGRSVRSTTLDMKASEKMSSVLRKLEEILDLEEHEMASYVDVHGSTFSWIRSPCVTDVFVKRRSELVICIAKAVVVAWSNCSRIKPKCCNSQPRMHTNLSQFPTPTNQHSNSFQRFAGNSVCRSIDIH